MTIGTHPHPHLATAQRKASEALTNLRDFPDDAIIAIHRPIAPGCLTTVQTEEVHVGTFFPSEGDYLLVSFANQSPDAWEEMKLTLAVGEVLELPTLLVGHGSREELSTTLHGSQRFGSLHKLADKPRTGAIFTLSVTFARILGINRGSRLRNGLILVRNGHIHYTWHSPDQTQTPHDWTTLLCMVGTTGQEGRP